MMDDESRIMALVEEILDSNASPEEACRECPQLLPAVRSRLDRFRSVEMQIGAVFPSRDSSDGPPVGSIHRTLPTIPGYEVLETIGSGGMGVVYRARQTKLNRVVAVKMLLAGGYAGDRELERFKREAEAVAALHHPNIVQIYDAGEHDGFPYFAMEFMDGGTLNRALAGAPQTVRKAAETTATLARAVHTAHVAGIVHRDLKPGNVLLASDGAFKIADFGLARRLDGAQGQAVTLEGAHIGTPSYMSPEQAMGRAVGPTTDVYSLGAILYEMLTGRPPFRGETAAETERQVIHDDPVRPSLLNPRTARDLETICLKCLQKAPGQRYDTSAALADDLDRFCQGHPIHARPVGRAERAWRWARRNPTAAALLITALMLVALTSAGGIWFAEQRADRRAETARRDAELRAGVDTALAQAASLRDGFHFREARQELDRVRLELEPSGPRDLRERVEHGLDDLGLVERLDAARNHAATIVGGFLDRAGAGELYAQAFQKAGLGRPGDQVEAVAAAVKQSAVHTDIVAALDDWASLTEDEDQRTWLLSVARAADPDPARDQVRNPEMWQRGSGLLPLALKLGVSESSPLLVTAVCRFARDRGESGDDRTALLTVARARFPQDFWINVEMGEALNDGKKWDEAISYFRAANALRPLVGLAQNELGAAYFAKGQFKDAIECFQEAVRLDPASATIHNNLGAALDHAGQQDKAIEQFRESIARNPEYAVGHENLGALLIRRGQRDEALREFREAVRLGPKVSARALAYLGHYQRETGDLDGAIATLRQAVSIDPHLQLAQGGLIVALYTSARASAQAGTRDAGVAEPERVSLRGQALERLQESLAIITRLKNEGTLPGFDLAYWQADPALSGVRTPVALEKLPEAEREQWQRLWDDVARQVAADPLVQARSNAARGNWELAASRYEAALAADPIDDGEEWFEYAAVLLLCGERPGYVKACAHMIERCGKEGGPRAYHVARACTLGRSAVTDISVPAGLAEAELRDNAREFWSLTEQGALMYRSGQYEAAAALFEQSLRADSKPGRAVVNWAWLALADARLGKTADAQPLLEKARALLDRLHDGVPPEADAQLGLHLHNWLEAQALLREAEAALRMPDASAK
jgi:serine/threonine-protein kinase